MRVIAGKYKSRILQTIKSNSTRPTTDKNKENLFNMLRPYLDGGVCLDLFAGSGGLGIEAISRGMDVLYSVDKNYQAYTMVKQNVATLKMDEEIHVMKSDYKKALALFEEEHIQFDLVLLDPPYGKKIIQPLLLELQTRHLLNKHSVVVCEDLKEEVFDEVYGELERIKEVHYGVTSLHIYQLGDKL